MKFTLATLVAGLLVTPGNGQYESKDLSKMSRTMIAHEVDDEYLKYAKDLAIACKNTDKYTGEFISNNGIDCNRRRSEDANYAYMFETLDEKCEKLAHERHHLLNMKREERISCIDSNFLYEYLGSKIPLCNSLGEVMDKYKKMNCLTRHSEVDDYVWNIFDKQSNKLTLFIENTK